MTCAMACAMTCAMTIPYEVKRIFLNLVFPLRGTEKEPNGSGITRRYPKMRFFVIIPYDEKIAITNNNELFDVICGNR